MNKTTVQDLIDFYEEKRQEYLHKHNSAVEDLTKGRLDEQDAHFKIKEIGECEIILGLVNGFLENLRKLEESE